MATAEPKRRIGIRDVAAAVGVSPTTVSHAFSGARALNPDTRARVIETAERLGYLPDVRARSLRGSRTYTLGFLSDVIASTPHAGRIVSGAQAAAAEHDSVLVVLDSDGMADRERRQIRTLLTHRVDGFIYARMFHRSVVVPDELRDQNVVLADATSDDPSLSSVVPDEHGIGLTATRHLIAAGHRRIALATIGGDVPAAHGREDGYRAALAEAGLAADERLVVRASGDPAGGYEAGVALLARTPRPTAVFCFNDEMAMGVYQAAAAAGISIPHELSVVGVDDLRIISAGLRPSLTTIALPHAEMGHWAASRLLAAVEGDTEPVQARLECALVERGSVAPPA